MLTRSYCIYESATGKWNKLTWIHICTIGVAKLHHNQIKVRYLRDWYDSGLQLPLSIHLFCMETFFKNCSTPEILISPPPPTDSFLWEPGAVSWFPDDRTPSVSPPLIITDRHQLVHARTDRLYCTIAAASLHHHGELAVTVNSGEFRDGQIRLEWTAETTENVIQRPLDWNASHVEVIWTRNNIRVDLLLIQQRIKGKINTKMYFYW